MNEGAERAIPLPLAFDTAIGYWTGEPDWELVETAISACAGSGAAQALRLHRQGGPPAESGGVTLTVAGTTLLVRGETAAVDAFVRGVEERLGCGDRH